MVGPGEQTRAGEARDTRHEGVAYAVALGRQGVAAGAHDIQNVVQHLETAQILRDGHVVLVHQHHDLIVRLLRQRPDQIFQLQVGRGSGELGETVGFGLHAYPDAQGVFQTPDIVNVAQRKIQPQHGMPVAHPVPVAFLPNPCAGEQILTALKQGLQSGYQQRLAKSARPGQKKMSLLHAPGREQVVKVPCLVHVQVVWIGPDIRKS